MKRALIDIIKDLELRLSGLLGWAVNPMTGVLIRGRRSDIREEHVKTEAEVGIILLQAKEHWRGPQLEEERRTLLWREHSPANYSILELGTQTVK